jgi:hypothetical protein
MTYILTDKRNGEFLEAVPVQDLANAIITYMEFGIPVRVLPTL